VVVGTLVVCACGCLLESTASSLLKVPGADGAPKLNVGAGAVEVTGGLNRSLFSSIPDDDVTDDEEDEVDGTDDSGTFDCSEIKTIN